MFIQQNQIKFFGRGHVCIIDLCPLSDISCTCTAPRSQKHKSDDYEKITIWLLWLPWWRWWLLKNLLRFINTALIWHPAWWNIGDKRGKGFCVLFPGMSNVSGHSWETSLLSYYCVHIVYKYVHHDNIWWSGDHQKIIMKTIIIRKNNAWCFSSSTSISCKTSPADASQYVHH